MEDEDDESQDEDPEMETEDLPKVHKIHLDASVSTDPSVE